MDSRAALDNGIPQQLGIQRPAVAVKNCREISKDAQGAAPGQLYQSR
ncbi:hypothetical protein [Thermostichus vulcanus]|uniref:Uncharacterized protein n=1 Tax=Thermostichus vulcanus str. 'Rupite' TaxID=2813851 RepID=A0ABT0CEC4_THEVL|nr:hypothetical protein [Thermostichus vulcanus]MCJ2544134.1 hypothetical protein [Thermostichus vulcanus str. 'Rupite']